MERVDDCCSGANASLDSSSFANSSGWRNFLHRSTVSASLSSCYWIRSNSACSYNLPNSAASYFFFSRSRSICSSLDWPDFFWETSFNLSWINRFSFLITYNSCYRACIAAVSFCCPAALLQGCIVFVCCSLMKPEWERWLALDL